MIIDGDLTCMHEIDEWIDDAQKKDKVDENNIYSFRFCVHYSDSASLLTLSGLSQFNLIASIIISLLKYDDLHDDVDD